MDDSLINPLMLSSSAHLENVEQLIKNLEKQTLNLDNFEHVINDQKRQELITKSFSSVSSSTMAIDDTPDDNFLVKSITLNTGGGIGDAHLSMDSLFSQRDLFGTDDIKKQQSPPGNDQSLINEQDGGFTWDDQYDARANYRLTFSTDKQQQSGSKTEKPHRHKHHHHHHHHHHQHRKHDHKQRSADQQSDSTYLDESISPMTTVNMNDWSIRSSFTALEQSIEQQQAAAELSPTLNNKQQSTTFVRSLSHPVSLSPQQQLPNNPSPGSSTTSSSSSASWRRMKESQRTTSGTEPKETRPPSPLSLYKIFQQKSNMASSSRSAFQIYREQNDSLVPNTNNESMTISGEKMSSETLKSSPHHHKRHYQNEKQPSQSPHNTDQAIQTSMIFDSSSNSSTSQMNSRYRTTPVTAPKSESYDLLSTHAGSNFTHHLGIPPRPSPISISSSSSNINKSLPDLAFLSQYSKELPRSRTTSPQPPSSSINTSRSIPSPSIVQQQQQQKQDSDRPRTLKSIKRYKNSKHSTEPLGVFYSPQLRKTFAAVPASAVFNGSDGSSTVIRMKLPPSSSSPSPQLGGQSSTMNLKSCLKYGSRAGSCDIAAMLQDSKPSGSPLAIPEPTRNRDSSSPSTKRRCSEADVLVPSTTDNRWPIYNQTTASSNDLNNQDSSSSQPLSYREHRSDYDLTSMLQQNQTKKSVSFSDNIAKHLISPCNPAISFSTTFERIDDQPMDTANHELTIALHGNKDGSSSKPSTFRYGEMRRCQTDIIVVDPVLHRHSFTESPPNEFRLDNGDALNDDDDDEDDQALMEKAHVNIVPTVDQPIPTTETSSSSTPAVKPKIPSNEKENNIQEKTPAKTPVITSAEPLISNSLHMNASTTTLVPSNGRFLDGLLERVSETVKNVIEIKRTTKAFFLNNEHISQLDDVLKNDLCTIIQDMLEHGLKLQSKDVSSTKRVTLWKIIETSINHGQVPQLFYEAKQIAQNASAYWLFKFQAFIFALLNKSQLINWLYHFTQQKDVVQRFYDSPDALVLVATPSTFNLFDRLMTQLEKLSPLAFRLTYVAPSATPSIPSSPDEQLNASMISGHSLRNGAREWVMTMSRRASRNLTQPIVQPPIEPPATAPSADTLRSTLSRKFNALFTKANPTTTTTNTTQQRKTASAVTAKLPAPKSQTVRVTSPATSRRPPITNVFANAAAAAAAASNKPVIVSSPRSNNTNRTGSMRRGISPSVVVAPSPPPALNTTTPTATTATFQSKIPRPSLNVDKPKSARYRSTALPPK